MAKFWLFAEASGVLCSILKNINVHKMHSNTSPSEATELPLRLQRPRPTEGFPFHSLGS